MVRSGYLERREHPPLLESLEILIAVIVMAAGWCAWYVAHHRYHFTHRQIEEVALYLGVSAVGARTAVWLLATRRSRRQCEWPHPPLLTSPKRDERCTPAACTQHARVLAYDVPGEPRLCPY